MFRCWPMQGRFSQAGIAVTNKSVQLIPLTDLLGIWTYMQAYSELRRLKSLYAIAPRVYVLAIEQGHSTWHQASHVSPCMQRPSDPTQGLPKKVLKSARATLYAVCTHCSTHYRIQRLQDCGNTLMGLNHSSRMFSEHVAQGILSLCALVGELQRTSLLWVAPVRHFLRNQQMCSFVCSHQSHC